MPGADRAKGFVIAFEVHGYDLGGNTAFENLVEITTRKSGLTVPQARYFWLYAFLGFLFGIFGTFAYRQCRERMQ